jgi:hypothetical protein
MVMKLVKTAISLGALLLLGLILVIVAHAQGPGDEQPVAGVGVQEEIGVSGLGDNPADGLEAIYMFSGVYNKESDPEFATVVHCTNIGSTAVSTVTVQFFDVTAGIPATAQALDVPSSATRTFSTQSIASFPNEINAGASVDIEHGSGWVRAPEGSELICTAQVLALDTSDVPTDMTKLHVFDSEGNLIGPNPTPGPAPGPGSGGIFMPIIFKNS